MKVIEELLQPSGVSVKPSETLFKSFIKRLKTLNNIVIFGLLYDKLQDYENMQDVSSNKTLMVSNNISSNHHITYRKRYTLSSIYF